MEYTFVDKATAVQAVTTGVERLCNDVSIVGDGRFALITNVTGTTGDLGRNIDALLTAGLGLTAILAPEHGLGGTAQAGDAEHAVPDAATGLPVYDTYLRTGDELDRLILEVGVDALVFDMQDVGARYYTYLWTMHDCMCAAARTGTRFIVLDRPNPLGGSVVSGPGVDDAFASFIGRIDIPIRHGLTAGEVARHINVVVLGDALELQIVAMDGWHGRGTFETTGGLWVPPSPNMPTLDTAFAFCGTALFEGTNLSEGRGTTTPFEVIGAPYLDGRFAETLRGMGLPGVLFRDTSFVPTFHAYAGQLVRGVQLHVTDRSAFDPIATALTMMGCAATLYPHDFSFAVPGERSDAPEAGWAIDRLWGSDNLRTLVASGADPRALIGASSTPAEVYGADVLIYGY